VIEPAARVGRSRDGSEASRRSGRRILLYAVVASLSASALLAVGILLFGDFGSTEGRILGTTALIAGYALLALPAGLLLDQGRLLRLAVTVLALAVLGFSLALAAVWASEPGDELGKSIVAVTAFAVASTQVAALAARRRQRDPWVRRLFAVSVALAVIVAALVSAAVWAETEREGYFRVVGALAVLDLLAAALQPILAFARPATALHRIRVLVEPDEEIEVAVEATDFAAAAANAVRTIERTGRRVLRLERVGPDCSTPGDPDADP
jgi:hypothetical protein